MEKNLRLARCFGLQIEAGNIGDLNHQSSTRFRTSFCADVEGREVVCTSEKVATTIAAIDEASQSRETFEALVKEKRF